MAGEKSYASADGVRERVLSECGSRGGFGVVRGAWCGCRGPWRARLMPGLEWRQPRVRRRVIAAAKRDWLKVWAV